MNDIEELKQLIKNKQVILFAGSGVSAHLNIPVWSELIGYLADEMGYDRDLFRSYGDPLALAEFYKIKKGHIGELSSWMDSKWIADDEAINNSAIYDAIVDLDFPAIYTTNYDHFLEKAFELRKKPYKRIINTGDCVGIDNNITRIVKFHGDTFDDSSMVLNESSYFERLDFSSSLDIMLKADMLGKSLLYIGYSLTDINIRYMIYKVDKIWKERKNNAVDKPSSYLFLTSPNPVQETILKQRGIKIIVGENIDQTKSLEEFIKKLI